MPIDFQGIKDTEEQNLRDLITQRQTNLESTLKKYSENARATRGKFFDTSLNPLLEKTLGSLNLSRTGEPLKFQTSNLEQTLKDSLASFRLGMSKENTGLGLSNAQRILEEATQNRQEGSAFAKQKAKLSGQEEFDAAQAEKDRQFQLAMEDIRDEYTKRGLSLEEQFTPQIDYEGALIRALGSITGTGAGIYAYDKLYRGQTPPFDYMNLNTPRSPFPKNLFSSSGRSF